MTRTRRRSGNSIVKVVFASLIGTAVEWYDFFLYGSAAALVFGSAVLPGSAARSTRRCSPSGPTPLGFVARPLGGVVFGHFGDRVGRKKMLVVALMMMGIATFAIGLLPTYASIGVAAPILLLVCRLRAGLRRRRRVGRRGADGRRARRRRASRLLVLVAAGRCAAGQPARDRRAVRPRRRSRATPHFEAWGWRIPFLLSAVLVLIGLYVRLQLEESPVYKEAKAEIAEKKDERVAHADPRGDQDLPQGGPHRDGHADGGEHLLLHLHDHLDHLRHGRRSTRTRT